MNRAGRAVMAMVAGALMLSAGPAVAGEPGLELIGATQIPFDSRFEGITIGGLSGLDRLRGDQYLAISDDKGDGRPPRFYQLSIGLDPAHRAMTVRVERQTPLRDARGARFPTDRAVVDPEGIRHLANGHILWSSEGTWSEDPALRVQPAIYESNAAGRVLRQYHLPSAYLYADNRTRGAASNGVLEGLAIAPKGGVFAINEVPAYEDGTANGPALHRLTRFDPRTGRPLRQYVYDVPDARYSVSELLAIDDRRFLSIERVAPFDMRQGVRARIVLSRIADDTTDVLSCPALPRCAAVPMTREVLLDLPGRYDGVLIDNLEGMAWGPRLPDGRRTLILVADDNFNPEETTQFLAFAWPGADPLR